MNDSGADSSAMNASDNDDDDSSQHTAGGGSKQLSLGDFGILRLPRLVMLPKMVLKAKALRGFWLNWNETPHPPRHGWRYPADMEQAPPQLGSKEYEDYSD